MPIPALPKLHSPLRRLLLAAACLAAGGCDSELAQSPLLMRAAHAQVAKPQPAGTLPTSMSEATTAAEVPGNGPAALHSYRDDIDPGHAAIASYRD